MTRAEYLAIDALNYSNGKLLLKSPAAFKQALEEPEDPLRHVVGKATHGFLLEEKDPRSHFAIKPEGMSFATTEGKKWRAAQTLPILKEQEANAVLGMTEAVLNHREASRALHLCKNREVVMQGEYKGVAIKGILDAVGRNVIEIKTCIDASDETFGLTRAVNKPFHYDLQVVWEMELSKLQVAWILVENTPPHTVNFVYPGYDIIASGQQKMDIIIHKYKMCTESGDWSAYACGDFMKELHEINGPKWRIMELETAGLI